MTLPKPIPPFAGSKSVALVLPSLLDGLNEGDLDMFKDLPALLNENRAAIELELGAPYVVTTRAPENSARWLIGPAKNNPAILAFREPAAIPQLYLDRSRQLLISDAPSAADIMDTFSYVRKLAYVENGVMEIANCRNLDEAIERIVEEVGDSYPSFELRGLDWKNICDSYIERVHSSNDHFAMMQAWLAELQDGHTWVRSTAPLADRPYNLWLTPEKAIFTRVPEATAAWQAGVRTGYWLEGEDTAGWWRRSAATPHSRALMTGRRFLMGEPGSTHRFVAVSPGGERITWEDTVPKDPWHPIAEWKILPSGTAYLKIKGWIKGYNLEEIVDEAFEAFGRAERLIVDLRGNLGGNLLLAQAFRNRFLPAAGVMGSIRTRCLGEAGLTAPSPIYAEPSPETKPWLKPVHFLTNGLTASASEDALLGLQGLDHVKVMGEPSAGASGRMRVIKLLSDCYLTVSTALTYDRQGRCIEGSGIPLDKQIIFDRFSPTAESLVLQAADKD